MDALFIDSGQKMGVETIEHSSILTGSSHRLENSKDDEVDHRGELFSDANEQELSAVTIGARLRRARESRHLYLDDAVKALKFSLRQFVALEAGEWHLLNGLAFTRGFLRGYAKWLDLDGEEILADATRCGALPEIRSLKTPATIPLELMNKGNPRSLLVWGAAITIFLLFALILSWPDLQRITLGDGKSTIVNTVATQSDAQYGAAPADENIEGPNTDNRTDLESLITSVLDGQHDTATEEDAADEAMTADETEAAKAGEPVLSFSVSASCWVEIRDQQNRIVMSENLPVGERVINLSHEPHFLVIGNARQVKMSYAGLAVDLTPFTASSGVARLKLQMPGKVEKVSLR